VEDIGKIFGDVIGQVVGSPPVQIGARLIVAYLVVLWLASAFWVFRDARRRTKNVLSPYLGAGGVVALTPFLFPLGVIAYRVVRPPETVSERAARDLESYVLAASVDHTRCRTCGRTVDETWMRCPACGSDLAVACPACGGRVEFDWSVCAWCAHDLEPLGDAATMPAPVVPIDVPAALADLGVAPLEPVDPLEDVPLDEPTAVDEQPRRGAIPGWDPTVVLPAAELAEASSEAPPRDHAEETEAGGGVPVFDPIAPGAPAAAWTTTWAASDGERSARSSTSPGTSGSSASRGSRTERRKQRVTVPPELERRHRR
jgi:hypothetical protein